MRNLLSRATVAGRLRAVIATSFLLAASSAQAAPVSFNFAGTGIGGVGTTVQVATFDELPGNALGQGAQALINAANALPPGTVTTTSPFTVYYQANVRLVDANGNTIDTPGTVFTAVAKFMETATVTAGSNSVAFNVAATQTGSYFDFFAKPSGVGGNNSTGVGFSNDTPGILIYSATPGPPAPSGVFGNLGGTANLDSTNPAIPPGTGQQTVTGAGGSRITFFTAFANSQYFVTPPGPSTTFNTNTNLPFTDVPPSSQFQNLSAAGSGSTFLNYVPKSLGTTNGLSPRHPVPGGRQQLVQRRPRARFGRHDPAGPRRRRVRRVRLASSGRPGLIDRPRGRS